MEEKVREVIALFYQTPCGEIHDADTILADIIDESDNEISEVCMDIFYAWFKSQDRGGIETVFEALTGVAFEEYINRCLNETTR